MPYPDNWSDKEVVAAFTRMARTVFIWVPWLIVTLYFALFKQWAFWGNTISPWIHIIFYIWILVTLPIFIRITIRKVWKMK